MFPTEFFEFFLFFSQFVTHFFSPKINVTPHFLPSNKTTWFQGWRRWSNIWHMEIMSIFIFWCGAMCKVKEAEIWQPWVANGHNAHTRDSREACQAIAFYDNFTPEKSRPIKIEPLSIAWILLNKRHRKNSRRIPSSPLPRIGGDSESRSRMKHVHIHNINATLFQCNSHRQSIIEVTCTYCATWQARA